MSPSLIEVSIKRGDVLIFAFISLGGKDPSWCPYLCFIETMLPFLEPFGGSYAGFYAHAMICALGVWGYLMKYIAQDKWEIFKNGDTVSAGNVYRFIAILDVSAMIPGTELEQRSTTTQSSTSTISSAEEDVGEERYIWMLAAKPATKNNFRPAVQARDGACVMTNFPQKDCEAAQLINAFNSHLVMDKIVLKRRPLGGEDEKYWKNVAGPYDVRVGLFLSVSLHSVLDRAGLGTYRVPNFGMKSLKEPADDIHILRASSDQVDSPDVPTALTEQALKEFSENLVAPAEWAGTKSSVYLVPFDPSGRQWAEMRFEQEPHKGPCQIRTPDRPADADNWPPNLCFDWAWGGRMLRVFGTTEALDYAKQSPLITLLSETTEEYQQHSDCPGG